MFGDLIPLLDKKTLWLLILLLLLLLFLLLTLIILVISKLYKYAERGRAVSILGISVGEHKQNDNIKTMNREGVHDNLDMAIHHISLPISDCRKAKRFYRDILNLKEVPRPKVFETLFDGVWFELPNGQQIHLVKGEGNYRHRDLNFGGNIPPDIHFAIRVSNKELKKIERRVQSENTKRISNSERPIILEDKLYDVDFGQIYIVDDDNHIIEITDLPLLQ